VNQILTHENNSAEILNEKETPKLASKWTSADAIETYNIDGWGAGYFSVNEEGHMTMLPEGQGGPAISIMDVVTEVQRQGIGLPCIIRFHDILRHRVTHLNETFAKVIREANYKANYRGVYPIKVNQMREVVEEIMDAGRPYHYGLEAGSKAELQVVLALNKDPEAVTICNGYKDSDYIRLALLGVQLGRKVIIVIEKFSELDLCLKVAKEVGVEPILGIRGKLSSKGAGRWEESGGDMAKFGLTANEIVRAVDLLRQQEKLSCLKLFHFHIGSQIPDIRTIKEAILEGARYYASLCKMGAPLEFLDVGGGLGVDYDGSQSRSDFSINYTFEEYVSDVVYQVQSVCETENVPQPNLVSESGRAVTALHSCLVMNVIDQRFPLEKKTTLENVESLKSDFVFEVYEILKNINLRNALESYHDAQAKREESLSRFKLGHLSLAERARVEEICAEINNWIISNMKRMKRIPDEFYELRKKILVQYVVNFSVFQSAPDHWAFDQLFPIVPIHRMNEKPKVNCTLVDITCDSDGEIDRFIANDEAYSNALRVHHLKPPKSYFLGMFLTGAYQDIMGDMHNLFGRVNEVHVFTDDDDPEDFYIEEVIRGDTISDILTANQYSVSELVKSIRQQIDQKIKDTSLKPRQGMQLVDFYTQVMQGYTYLRN